MFPKTLFFPGGEKEEELRIEYEGAFYLEDL
jgi:hypothetical protein